MGGYRFSDTLDFQDNAAHLQLGCQYHPNTWKGKAEKSRVESLYQQLARNFKSACLKKKRGGARERTTEEIV